MDYGQRMYIKRVEVIPKPVRGTHLLEQLRDAKTMTAIEAAEEIVQEQASPEDILRALASETESVRLKERLIPVAARMTGALTEGFRLLVIRLATHRESSVRLAVADALGRLRPGEDTKNVLQRLTSDPIGAVADSARESLVNLE